ncbi:MULTISPECIES: phosphatase PAP2 family protein [Halorussus]|uniref:phosphatase PAP2 family protein n=1 Tax=Halorussus TaxID=1070314 RepID=UPI00209F56EA|nr:phosphatase PAP2 family protein [Halorussus vallis]USZ73847.1 phosphatase PAP2 family protein [Halorussus vallis]
MNGRGFGIAQALEQLLPPLVREAFTVLTQLGDAWFIFTAVALLYWFGEREEGAFALGAVLGALALTVALKGLFELPRPPAGIRVGHASGYGFPSGHAIGATVLWGVLVEALEHRNRRWRAIAAAAVVAVVLTSRVVIGVHYFVDVAVGALIGLAYLGGLLHWGDWRPRRAFAAAGVFALAALATAGLSPDAVATLAGVVGAGATWLTFDGPPRTPVNAPAAFAGLLALAAVGYVGNELELSLLAVFGLNMVVPAGILLLPVAVDRAREMGSGTPIR